MTIPRRGYSFIELIVAVAILATCILLMIGLFLTFLNASQKAVDLTGGTVVAGALLNQEVYAVGTDPVASSTFWNTIYAPGTVLAGGAYPLNSVTYFYQLYCQDLDMGTPLINPVTNTPTHLKRIDAIVWWWAPAGGPQARAGSGRLQVERTRLMWPSAPF